VSFLAIDGALQPFMPLESSVFKPKDEEPYGRLNPKVKNSVLVSMQHNLLFPFFLADHKMDSPAISVDHPVWPSMPYTES